MSSERFNADLVIVARDWRRLSQSELASKLGISQGHLSKIEHRLIEPDETMVEKLGSVLDVPTDFFLQPHRLVGGPMSAHAMFRKKSSIGKRVMDHVMAEINVRLLTVKRMFASFDVEAALSIPSYDIDADNGTPEDIADSVRRAWLLPRGPIRNLTLVAEEAGIVINSSDFAGSDIDGATLAVPGFAPCVFLNSSRPADRVRFSLAHEIGHLVMHRQPSDTMEDEANAFASALLMPRQEFVSSCGPKINLPELARLKAIWRVSMQAALYRAKQLHLVSHNQATYLWRQISKLGYRKVEPVSTEIERENPATISTVIQTYFEQFEYTVDELARSVHLSTGDFCDLYQINLPRKPLLRRVK